MRRRSLPLLAAGTRPLPRGRRIDLRHVSIRLCFPACVMRGGYLTAMVTARGTPGKTAAPASRGTARKAA
ncbi:hypothetical protein NMD1_01304 [Novosphingobium sp. MD-1]|nr:hypothetical protein NMD1_01304 [Novosphingobium sp. MD-1]